MEKAVTLKPVEQFGREDYMPRCELSRAICDIQHVKSLGNKTIEKLIKHNFKVYYSADEPNVYLESVGAKRK